MANKLAIAYHLNDFEHNVLIKTYASHHNAMSTGDQKVYSIANIDKVKRNVEEECLEVYFKNGEWFKYYTDGTWG